MPNITMSLPRLAFVHVPKTAGSSLTAALANAYGASTLPAMTTLDYPCYTGEQLASFRFYKGHAYRRDYARLPADTRRFTVLRDPVERAVSYFNYYRTLDVSDITDPFALEACELARTASPVEFIYADSPFVIEHLRCGQLRQFLPEDLLATIGHRQFLSRRMRGDVVAAALEELRGFTAVLTCDMLFLGWPLFVRQLGLPQSCARLPHLNVAPPGEPPDLADVRRALIDVNAAEFCCYHAIRQREQRWLAESFAAHPYTRFSLCGKAA